MKKFKSFWEQNKKWVIFSFGILLIAGGSVMSFIHNDVYYFLGSSVLAGVIAGLVALINKDEELKFKMNESFASDFIVEKITAYKRIQSIANLMNQHKYLDNSIVATCVILEKYPDENIKAMVHYSELFSSLPQLIALREDVQDLLVNHKLVLEPKLVNDLDTLNRILFTLIALYEKSSDLRKKSLLLSYLVFTDMRPLVDSIHKHIAEFYSKRRFLKLGFIHDKRVKIHRKRSAADSRIPNFLNYITYCSPELRKDHWKMEAGKYTLTDSGRADISKNHDKIEKAYNIFENSCSVCTNKTCIFKTNKVV